MAGDILSLYHLGLRNAHALEQEATQIIQRQLDRLENYPAVSERLRLHLDETHQQQKRLEQILERHATSHSAIKDLAAGLMGNLAALGHAPAGDEILKNSFANYAFEHFEIASYKALIIMAEAAGDSGALALLRTTLQEEQSMADWIDSHLKDVTSTYMARATSGQKADR